VTRSRRRVGRRLVRRTGRARRLSRTRSSRPEDLTTNGPELQDLLGRLVRRVLVEPLHEDICPRVVGLVAINGEIHEELTAVREGVDGRLPEVRSRNLSQSNRLEVTRRTTIRKLVIPKHVRLLPRGRHVILASNDVAEEDRDLHTVVIAVDLTQVGQVNETIPNDDRIVCRILKLLGRMPTLKVSEVLARVGHDRRRIRSSERTGRLSLPRCRIADDRTRTGDPELETVGTVAHLDVATVLNCPLVELRLGGIPLDVVTKQAEEEAATSWKSRNRDLPNLSTRRGVRLLERHRNGLVMRLRPPVVRPVDVIRGDVRLLSVRGNVLPTEDSPHRDDFVEADLVRIVRVRGGADRDEPLPQILLTIEGQQAGDVLGPIDAGQEARSRRVRRSLASSVVGEEAARTAKLVPARPTPSVGAGLKDQARDESDQNHQERTRLAHSTPPQVFVCYEKSIYRSKPVNTSPLLWVSLIKVAHLSL